ncbi:hypothetical protein BJ993_001087 [Nocardioides aromaticivorans]|uniref:Uncharacterized protein n=1 Tax=Nocardioides aromaticivorans TaxID=200618 RepID=A0A7Y9ZEM8_9ACTN|nr:hypothetical protein [Nocardioides aromaticivorans]NYI44007.1 hypothetical protein [Nocardioides aromaticivorans]
MGKSLLGKLGGIGVAIIVAIVFYVVRDKGEEKIEQAKAPDVGDCVYFEKDGLNDEAKDATCGDAKSSHKVVGDDGSCGTNETTYKVTKGAGSDDELVSLCLVLDAKKGDCFDINEEAKVVCADTKGQPSSLKVVSVAKAGGKCANPAQPLEYEKRNTLLCLAPNA